MDTMVEHPQHYQSSCGLEVIEVIDIATKNLVGIEAVDTGNAIKYLCRWKKKNGLQDLEKADWYIRHLIRKVNKNHETRLHYNFSLSNVIKAFTEHLNDQFEAEYTGKILEIMCMWSCENYTKEIDNLKTAHIMLKDLIKYEMNIVKEKKDE